VAPPKTSFLDKVLGRIGRLDNEGLQTVVQRLARERSFLETLFNTIEDGVLVVDEAGRILYFNEAVTRLIGVTEDFEGEPVTRILPEMGGFLTASGCLLIGVISGPVWQPTHARRSFGRT